ncbi:MAG: AsnC family transcriptional regulator [Desulfurococcales archaeon ex4484_42]|nr:MAG: AsnC family transcriptional regulator [Desulfurococcales archaeon ex4484_42]
MIKDEVDRKLVKLLQKDGRASLVFLAKKLGMSHVGVKKRLEKLISSGDVRVSALLNSKDYVFAVIIAELESYEYFRDIAERFKDCPRLLFLAPLIGGMNYIAIMAFEDIDTLESCINECAIRALGGIRRSEVFIAKELVVPSHIHLRIADPVLDVAPCGFRCSECPLYREGKCPACPATKHYRPLR